MASNQVDSTTSEIVKKLLEISSKNESLTETLTFIESEVEKSNNQDDPEVIEGSLNKVRDECGRQIEEIKKENKFWIGGLGINALFVGVLLLVVGELIPIFLPLTLPDDVKSIILNTDKAIIACAIGLILGWLDYSFGHMSKRVTALKKMGGYVLLMWALALSFGIVKLPFREIPGEKVLTTISSFAKDPIAGFMGESQNWVLIICLSLLGVIKSFGAAAREKENGDVGRYEKVLEIVQKLEILVLAKKYLLRSVDAKNEESTNICENYHVPS